MHAIIVNYLKNAWTFNQQFQQVAQISRSHATASFQLP